MLILYTTPVRPTFILVPGNRMNQDVTKEESIMHVTISKSLKVTSSDCFFWPTHSPKLKGSLFKVHKLLRKAANPVIYEDVCLQNH